jgi:hypothetical protein
MRRGVATTIVDWTVEGKPPAIFYSATMLTARLRDRGYPVVVERAVVTYVRSEAINPIMYAIDRCLDVICPTYYVALTFHTPGKVEYVSPLRPHPVR